MHGQGARHVNIFQPIVVCSSWNQVDAIQIKVTTPKHVARRVAGNKRAVQLDLPCAIRIDSAIEVEAKVILLTCCFQGDSNAAFLWSRCKRDLIDFSDNRGVITVFP